MKRIFLFSFIFLFIDQIIKFLIDRFMVLNTSIILIKDFFSITYVHNDGAAFSILSGNRIFLIIVTIISLFLILKFLIPKDIRKLDIITYSMLIGGILGNFIDRIFRGYVIDFLDFNLFGYNYPIFNFADILIVVSVILIIIIEFKRNLLCKNI